MTGYVRNLISQTGLQPGRRHAWPMPVGPVAGQDRAAIGVRPLELDVEVAAAPPERKPDRRPPLPQAPLKAGAEFASEAARAPGAPPQTPASRDDDRPAPPVVARPVVPRERLQTGEPRSAPRQSATERQAGPERSRSPARRAPGDRPSVEFPKVVQERELAAEAPEPVAAPAPDEATRRQPPSWTMRELRRWLAETPDPQEEASEERDHRDEPVRTRQVEDRRRPPPPRRSMPKRQEKEVSISIGSVELIVEAEPMRPTQPLSAPAASDQRATDRQFALRRHYLRP
jgi:hypothetical protein